MKTNHIYIFLFFAFFGWALPGILSAKDFKIVLDPGHGGHDPGAIGARGKEKDINLSVALKVGKLIEQNCNDTKVVYTRKTDVFIPLHERADIANNEKADLFISIHTNSVASRSTKVSGTETYTLGLHRTQDNLEVAKKENSVILIESDYKQRYAGFNPNSSESYIIFEFMQDKNMSHSVSLAQHIQKQFKLGNRIDKGVHQAGFLVLRETSMPSVLIELGYISNPIEEAYLLSENGTSTLAKCIYNAFLKYKQSQNHHLNAGRPVELNEKPDSEATQPPTVEPVVKRDTDKVAAVEKPKSTANQTVGNRPVFKIQILTSPKVLAKKDYRLKGLTDAEYYQENGLYKYTYGNDTNYNEIVRIKRKIVDAKFKDAFIVAFLNGEKINTNEAIKLFKKNR